MADNQETGDTKNAHTLSIPLVQSRICQQKSTQETEGQQCDEDTDQILERTAERDERQL